MMQFAARFADDKTCADYLLSLRYPNGYVCKTCGSRRAWACAQKPGMMICDAGHKVSVTAGTSLHRTKIPLHQWFYAAWLVATLKPGISALQFQRQMGFTRFETAFTMLHKLRAGLYAPDREKLSSLNCDDPTHTDHWIEMDQMEIGGEQTRADRALHGSNKTIVMVAVEVHKWFGRLRREDAVGSEGAEHADGRKRQWHTRAGRCRMRLIGSHNTYNVHHFLDEYLTNGSTIATDAHASFNWVDARFRHRVTVAARDADPLPTLGRVAANLLKWLNGTHKGAVSGQHLQAYLNEYVFRFNRRDIPWVAFNRALGLAALERDAIEYEGLYKHTWVHPNPANFYRQGGLF